MAMTPSDIASLCMRHFYLKLGGSFFIFLFFYSISRTSVMTDDAAGTPMGSLSQLRWTDKKVRGNLNSAANILIVLTSSPKRTSTAAIMPPP
jgi:hypothetical protein